MLDMFRIMTNVEIAEKKTFAIKKIHLLRSFLLQTANDQFFGKNHQKNVNFDAFVVVVTQSIYLNL